MLLFGIENLALDSLFERLANRVDAAFDKFLLHIHHNNIEAFLGNFLSDAAAHITCTDNRDFLYL